MKILNQIKAIVIVTGLLSFVLIPGVVIAAPFNLRRRLKIIGPVWILFSKSLLNYACSARVKFSEDRRSGPFRTTPAYGLYISNHQSYLDIPLLSTVFQIPPIMKKEVLYLPIFGWIAWLSGALPVSRSDLKSRKKVFDQAKKRIKSEGLCVQVYPEGTRSKDALPKEFSEIKKTLLIFAYREKIPVIPTSIFGTREVLSDWGVIQKNKNLGIIVHQELLPENFLNAEEFSKACWEKVREGYFQMKKELNPQLQN